jgi:uncharacterized protein DUF3800
VYFAFVDDVKQKSTREGMGPLVGAGAVLIPGSKLASLEEEIHKSCKKFGFPIDDPKGSEFKWSPGRELWMYNYLPGSKRDKFFLSLIELLSTFGAQAVVVIEDTEKKVADQSSLSHEINAARLLLERLNKFLASHDETAVAIFDRPSGDRKAENDFLAFAIDMLREGTRFVKFSRIALNVLCTQSRFVRLLQVADLVTSCTGAYVAGEEKFSPPIFRAILPLLWRGSDRVGGYGLKIHPDHKYANLYHWLLNDTHFWKRNCGHPLPLNSHPYRNIPDHCDAWRIWMKVLDVVKVRRPLILSWMKMARPYRIERDVLKIYFTSDLDLCLESLQRPNR